MNALALLAALQIAPGQNLCWLAALPSDSPRTPLVAHILSVEQLPTSDPGAWIQTTRYPGVQFHVLVKDLAPCAGADPAVSGGLAAAGKSTIRLSTADAAR